MQQKRLESLDVLRGLDMFLLTIVGPVVVYFFGYGSEGILGQFSHCDWVGFTLWDIIMPLFLFMSGITIPFSMSKYLRYGNKGDAVMRILRRVILLWVLGMIAQGNLLTFDPVRFKYYSNTLQAIAVGYFFCGIGYLINQKPAIHILSGIVLLLAFWAMMEFVKIGPYGGGDYSKDYNICQYLDKFVQGGHRDGHSGRPFYYTFVPSSINFIVTMIMGMLSGMLLKGHSRNKTFFLIVGGAAIAALGWLWGLEHPVIKRIWTSSFTLVAGGYSMVLMGIFYWLIDVQGWCREGLGWLKIFGMNAILAYMMHQLASIYHIGTWIQIPIIIAVLALCYWKKIFIKI